MSGNVQDKTVNVDAFMVGLQQFSIVQLKLFRDAINIELKIREE